jgi:hypothetical protein
VIAVDAVALVAIPVTGVITHKLAAHRYGLEERLNKVHLAHKAKTKSLRDDTKKMLDEASKALHESKDRDALVHILLMEVRQMAEKNEKNVQKVDEIVVVLHKVLNEARLINDPRVQAALKDFKNE